jgi:hypothetical protein
MDQHIPQTKHPRGEQDFAECGTRQRLFVECLTKNTRQSTEHSAKTQIPVVPISVPPRSINFESAVLGAKFFEWFSHCFGPHVQSI